VNALACKSLDDLPALLTYDEAADYLRRSRTTVRRLVADGVLRIVTVGGGRPLIDRESIREAVSPPRTRR
jgi:excisionase family DNA binding protein